MACASLTRRFAAPSPGGRGGLPEGVFQIRDQVFDVFDSDGDADEAITDAEFAALCGGNGSMSHCGGVGDECFDAAETFAKRAKPHSRKESLRLCKRAKIKGDHATESGHLSFRDSVTRM